MAHTSQPAYNPCSLAEQEQTPAKIWELLRRNEAFRADVQRLVKLDSTERNHHARNGQYHGSAWHKSRRLVERVRKRHPFAGIALQWLVPEPLFLVHRVTWPLGKQWKAQSQIIPRLIAVGARLRRFNLFR